MRVTDVIELFIVQSSTIDAINGNRISSERRLNERVNQLQDMASLVCELPEFCCPRSVALMVLAARS